MTTRSDEEAAVVKDSSYDVMLAVSLVFFITTLFYTLAIAVSFDKPWWVAAFFFAVYALIDVSFLSSNLLKFVTGGWFTVTVTIIVFLAMMIWRAGRHRMLSIQKAQAEPLTHLAEANATESDGLPPHLQHSLQQKQGHHNCDTLICYTKHIGHTPQMLTQLKRNIAVNPRQLILLHVKPATSPYVLKNVTMSQLSPHIFLAVVEYGYCDAIPTFAYIRPLLTHAMLQKHIQLDEKHIANLVGTDVVSVSGSHPWHRRYLLYGFKYLQKLSTTFIPSLELPIESTINMENIVLL